MSKFGIGVGIGFAGQQQTPLAAGLPSITLPSNLTDDLGQLELQKLIPGIPNPESSWLDYQCEVLWDLDPGTVLHKPLPQRVMPIDTLGIIDVNRPDIIEKEEVRGINLYSQSSGVDFVQKAATSTYRCGLVGYGIRVGFPIPVPRIVSIANVSPVPTYPQRITGNRIIANYNGVPVWFCRWELWYYFPYPPRTLGQNPPADLAEKIGGDAKLPTAIQEPVSIKEDVNKGGDWPTFLDNSPRPPLQTGIPK